MVLPDINFWIALTFAAHAGHRAAQRWLSPNRERRLAFCRMTQQGFLRLITNPAVLGDEALTMTRAWQLYDSLQELHTVTFLIEPAGLEATWRRFTGRATHSPTVWSDAYLAAFGCHAPCRVLTLDHGFTAYEGLDCEVVSV